MILLISTKNKYATRRLIEEAAKANVGLEAFDVEDLAVKNFQIDIAKYTVLFVRQANPYFKEIIHLAKQFHEQQKAVVDVEMILHGFETSKWEMYKNLKNRTIQIPETVLLKNYKAQFTDYKPFVLKWVYGFGGKHTFLIKSEAEYKQVIGLHSNDEWLVQEYIDAEFEYEVFTMGHKALPVILKFKIKDGFKADLQNYHGMSSATSLKMSKFAERASVATGRGLAKVDILEKDNHLYILEVNRCPSLVPFEQFTGYNVASAYIQYLSSLIYSKNTMGKTDEVNVPQQPAKPQEPVQPVA